MNCPAFTSQTLLSESWTSRFCRSVLLHYFFANDSGLVKLCGTSVRLKRGEKKLSLLQCSDSTSAVKQANRVETTYLLSKPNASAENLQVPLAEVRESPQKIARAEGQSLQLQMVLIRPWGPKGRKM